MLWGCMTWNGIGRLVFIDGIMNGEMYRDIINNNLPLTNKTRKFELENAIFQHDNDPKHTAKVTQKWFEDSGVQVLDWPAQSPDLNPIEHMWNEIKRRIRNLKELPTSEIDLKHKTHQIWYGMETEFCQRLIATMPERIQSVLKVKGGYTKW